MSASALVFAELGAMLLLTAGWGWWLTRLLLVAGAGELSPNFFHVGVLGIAGTYIFAGLAMVVMPMTSRVDLFFIAEALQTSCFALVGCAPRP